MDKGTQVQIHYPDTLVSLEDILREETAKSGKKKHSSETKRSSSGSLMKKLTLLGKWNSKPTAEGPEDLVRFCTSLEDKDSLDMNICQYHDVMYEPKLALIRGSSLSLIELPTFLDPGATLGTVFKPAPLYDPTALLEEKLSKIREKQCQPKMGKRSQWTVMCVAIGFFSSCLVIVGGMLSITSEYQDRAIAQMLNITIS